MSRWFRVARPASFARNYAKTLGQTALFWAVFLVALPAVVSAVEGQLGTPQFDSVRWVAAVVFVLFGAMALSSAYTMTRVGQGTPLPLDAPRHLVVAGAYRYIRNPMAVAGLIQGAATGLWFGSPATLAYVTLGAVLWNYLIRPAEEADLQRRFGDQFDQYRQHVHCWRPRLTPYHPERQHPDLPGPR